jgi:hypothetical protein
MRVTFYGFSLIATLLLISVSAGAQVNSSQVVSNTSPPAKLGIIKGRVVNEAGRPLPNVMVVAVKLNSNRGDSSAVADREGNFELTGLEPASYRLFAQLAAYTLVFSDALENQYRVGDSVTLVLTKGGVITGTVTNEAGEPLAGVRVRAITVHGVPWPYGLIPAESTTDDRGVYRIYGLAAGTYVVRAGGPGDAQYEPNAYETDVATYAPSSNRDTAEEIDVRAGVETSNVDIRYRGGSGHVISGIASGPTGVQTMGFGIFLSAAKDNGSQAAATSNQTPDGKHFALEGIDDGDYDISAVSARSPGEFMLSPAKRITVKGADVTGVELIVQPLSTVSGRVVLDEAKIADCSDTRRPLFSETSVSAFRNEKEVSAYRLPPFLPVGSPVNVDAQGNVTLKNLSPGRYYFATQFAGKYWYLQSVALPSSTGGKNSKPIDASRTWTTLNSGDQLTGLTITLAQGAASLRGQLAQREGETPKNLFVYLIPREKERAEDVLRFYAAAVSVDGTVALNHVAPGRYWVLVQETADNASVKLRLPDEIQRRAKLRRDAEAASTEIEFKPCQSVVDYRVSN